MAFKITVDKEKCIGCAACVSMCDNFEMQKGKAIVKEEVVEEAGCNKDAADLCPVRCIFVEEQ